MPEQTNDRRFADLYTACHSNSCFHDLNCNHRIEVAYNTEDCGTNCKCPMRDAPFVCPHCLIADVRLEMSFEGLDVRNPGNDTRMTNNGPSREKRIQSIADAELKKLVEQGRRMCKIAPKFVDPKLQFFHQFLVEEGYEGPAEDLKTSLNPKERYKRPGLAKKPLTSNAWKPRESVPQADLPVGGETEVESTLADFMKDWLDVKKRIAPGQLQKSQTGPVAQASVDSLLEHLKGY